MNNFEAALAMRKFSLGPAWVTFNFPFLSQLQKCLYFMKNKFMNSVDSRPTPSLPSAIFL
jgi:hypothetical protein